MSSAFCQKIPTYIGTSFTPTQIPGCQLWIDVSDPTTTVVSGNVTYIKDKSVNNVTTTLSSTAPAYNSTLINGLPGINFGGASWIRGNFASTYSGSNLIVFTVASVNGSAALYGRLVSFSVPGVLDYSSTSYVIPTLRQTTNPYVESYRAGDLAPIAISYGTNYVFGAEFTGSVNNFYLTGGTPASTASSGGFSISNWGIGYLADYGGTNDGAYWNGNFGECIVYLGSVTTLQRQQVEGYLAWKWGLQSQLPSGHPYKSASPNTATSGLPGLSTPFPLPSTILKTVPFYPTQIPGCQIWFDAADTKTMVTSGTSLISWTSKGLNAITTTNVSNSASITTYNGLPALFFNSNVLMTTNAASNYGTSGTTWIAASTNLAPISASSPPDGAVVIATGSAGAERSIRYDPTTLATLYSINGGTLRQATGINDNGVRGFIDTAAYLSAYQNGSNVASNTTAVTFQSGINQSFKLGQWNVGYLYGYVNEIIIFDTALSLSNYQRVEGYLAWRWGFQRLLPSSHPYYSSNVYAPTYIPGIYPLLTNPTSITKKVWAPTSYSGCRLWLDAQDNSKITLTSGYISAVVDKSLGTTFSNVGSTPSQLTLAPNSIGRYQSFYFNNAAGNYVGLYGNLNQLTTGTAMFVMKYLSSQNGPWRPVFGWNHNGSTQSIAFGTNVNGSGQAGPYVENIGQGTSLSTLTNNGLYVVSFTFNGTATGVGYNGALALTSGTVPSYSGSGTTIGIGEEANATQCTNIYLGEIILYNTILSDKQRQQMEGFLAWKWGIQSQLPAAHPYAKVPPPPV